MRSTLLLAVILCFVSNIASAQTIPVSEVPEYTTVTLSGDRVIGDFVVGPGAFDLQLAPGEAEEVLMTVSNRTGVTQTFTLSVEDMTGSADPTESVVLLGDDQGPYTIRDFISVPQPVFDVPHNTRVTIPVTVALPANAEPGGRYGSVLVSIVSAEPDESAQGLPRSAIVSRIGTLFFLTTPGDNNPAGELIDFDTVGGQVMYATGPVSFGLLYDNQGNVHLNPYGEISITNIFGEEVGWTEVTPWFAMPQSDRLREVTWSRTSLFGRYTATAQINRGYDNIIDTKSVTFWVINWTVLITIFVGISLLLFLTRFVATRFEFKRKDTSDTTNQTPSEHE